MQCVLIIVSQLCSSFRYLACRTYSPNCQESRMIEQSICLQIERVAKVPSYDQISMPVSLKQSKQVEMIVSLGLRDRCRLAVKVLALNCCTFIPVLGKNLPMTNISKLAMARPTLL